MFHSLFSAGNWVYRLPPALFDLSLTASIVILAVLLARLLLRRAPRVYSYALWAVVAFRLICPVSFSSQFSLLGLLNAPVAESGQVEYVPVDIVHTENPAVDLLVPELSETINRQLPQGEEQLTADPLEAPAALLTEIWLVGVLVLLIWALCSCLSLRRKMRTAVLLEGNVFQSEHVRSPFILGLVRPRIFIPYGLDDSALRCVLAHERCHLKRGDHIVKVFSFALLAIHWFNPLCWLAFHLMNRDMEMSCDEKVLAGDPDCKTSYSTVLLSFAANRRFPAPCPLAFGETGAKSRIKNALKWKRPKVWVTILAALLCLAVTAACAADPVDADPNNPDDNPAEHLSSAADEALGHAIDSDQLSAYTAFQFWVHFDCTHVTATCTTGQLLDPESVSYGRELTYAAGQPICWAHLTDDLFYETDDCTPMISYTVYDGDAVQHTGHLLLTRNEIDNGLMSSQYTAVRVDENGQPLARGSGGTDDVHTYSNHDLTAGGSVTLTPAQLPTYLFQTNSTKIAVKLKPADQPAQILLYAADAPEPLLTCALDVDDPARCVFTNLTSSRYYHLAVSCGEGTELTISDG